MIHKFSKNYSLTTKYTEMLKTLIFACFVLGYPSVNMSDGEIFHNYDRSMLQEEYPGFGDEFVIFPGQDGEDVYGYLKDPDGRFIFDDVVAKDIFFTIYNRNHSQGWKVTNQEELSKYFDKSKKTKFVTHGWMSKGMDDMCATVKDSYLNNTDYNIFVVDWNAISGNVFYPIPMKLTIEVSKYYANFLNYLVDDVGANPADIHLIGHSLGAHVSGFAGRRVKKGKIGRITGLDPAGPGFDQGLIEGTYLNVDDAEFVDIIHTCAGFLGSNQMLGHVDFFPNGGGPPQPGCSILKFLETCSHGRSWKLFAESIKLDEAYMARRCENWDTLKEKKCGGDEVAMGETTPSHVRGIYYLETSDTRPYLLNENKID